MNEILIIPDVHGRLFWKEATSKYENRAKKIIFIGDYLDPYQHENITRKDAIRNFEEIIEYKTNNEDKVVLLLGNHDLHYISKNFHTRSRYDSSNAHHINEDFKKNKNLFKLAHEEIIGNKKYLFTHAGLMNSWVERNKNVIGKPTVENLNHLLETQEGVITLTNISSYRTWLGDDSGSIVWSDVREKIDAKSTPDNIIPNDDSIIDGYDYQIFGHTQQVEKPIVTDKWACLDCREAFLIDEDGIILQVTENNSEINTKINKS